MMNPLSTNKNKTTAFILPLACKGFTHDQLITDGFINAYIADIEKPEWDDYVLLVYNEPKELENVVVNSYTYVLEADIDYLYIFEIPDDLLPDYFKIIQGDYTKISDKAKQMILSFWEVDEKSSLYNVLYGEVQLKLGDRKKAEKIKEVLSPLRLYEEVYGMGSGL